MSFTEFCCRSGGSNLNAGTRTGNSTEPGTGADLTYASGNWVASTGVFTPASGDPVADGVAVGDFASVYADGATVTGFVGRVTARTTTTITVSLTAKAGTAPTDGTGTRTLKIGGAWQGPNGSSGFPFTLDFANATNSSSHLPRINFKNDADYSITANIANATTYTVLQGYTTSYGDGGKAVLKSPNNATSFTLLTINQDGTSIVDSIFKENGNAGALHGLQLGGPPNRVKVFRCVAHSIRGNGFHVSWPFDGRPLLVECEAYDCNGSNTSNFGGFYADNSTMTCIRCISHDNTQHGFSHLSGQARLLILINCISDTNTGVGIFGFTDNAHVIINCDLYNNTSHGISLGSLGATSYIENCNFIKNGGWGINRANNFPAIIRNNAFGSGTQANTSGKISSTVSLIETGTIDYPSDAIPYVDAPNGDFSITLAEAKNAGRGAYTQTQSGYAGTVGYPDIGAAQSQCTGGGGGGVRMVNIRGGVDQ